MVKLNPGARKPHGKPIWPVEGLEPSATNRPFHAARPRRLQKTTIYTCKGKAQSRKSLTIELQPEQTLRLKDHNPRKSSIFSVILLTSFFFFFLLSPLFPNFNEQGGTSMAVPAAFILTVQLLSILHVLYASRKFKSSVSIDCIAQFLFKRTFPSVVWKFKQIETSR